MSAPRLLTLLLVTASRAGNATPTFDIWGGDAGGRSGQRQRAQPQRGCTVEELLPFESGGTIASEWSKESINPSYDCSCPFFRGRYFCPNLGDEGHPEWVPKAVANGTCQDILRADLIGKPLPPNLKVLIYGNSHLRQVVEALLCVIQKSVERKRMTIWEGGPKEKGKEGWEDREDVILSGDAQCRACFCSGCTASLGQLLVDNGCMGEGDTCGCSDDYGEFFFADETVVHYHFADREPKRIEFALKAFGGVPLSHYDVVIANGGNGPSYMKAQSLLDSALAIRDAGSKLLWLSEYDGTGAVGTWNKNQQKLFAQSGAMYLPVHYMVRGLKRFTKGVVEPQVNANDPHFCLPGPPDEVGTLLLKLIWAMHEDRR